MWILYRHVKSGTHFPVCLWVAAELEAVAHGGRPTMPALSVFVLFTFAHKPVQEYLCDFHASAAALSHLGNFKWLQSRRGSPTLTWISLWHYGKWVGGLNAGLFSGTAGGLERVRLSERLLGKHDPVSAAFCLNAHQHGSATIQAEWDL